jgi:uncharacterized protein
MGQVREHDSINNNEAAPFHLSIISHSLQESRKFYGEIFGCEERRATPTSAHFDWFGSQLTIHEVAGHSALNLHREVDAEEVPVPHFGAVLDEPTFHRVANNLKEANWDFTLKPHKRFLEKDWEQWVLFVLDPAGNAIEVKNFTRIPKGRWR